MVLSEKTGRKFGTYGNKTAAEKRLAQIEFFKHLRAAGLPAKPPKKKK